jgi:hypothetical protein
MTTAADHKIKAISAEDLEFFFGRGRGIHACQAGAGHGCRAPLFQEASYTFEARYNQQLAD